MLGFILHLIKVMPVSDVMFKSVIDPLTIGLVIGGAKTLAGGIQALAAGKKRPEPKYEIPQEVFQATQMAQDMARTGMPEASRMQALQGAQQSALFGMRAAQDRRGGLASISNIQAGLDRSNLAVAAQDASMRLQNQRFAQQALMTQAQYRDKAFANQWQSWMNKEQQRRANIGAGLQNIMGGIDLAGSMAAMGALRGGGGTTQTTNIGTANQLGRGIAGGPSISDYLATSPFNTSQIVSSSYNQPSYNTNLNSYMPGSYGALMGIPGVSTTRVNTPVQIATNLLNTGGNFLWNNPR
jgi:hypothetical protein